LKRWKGFVYKLVAVSESTFPNSIILKKVLKENSKKKLTKEWKTKLLIFELNWMLSYYKTWDYALKSLKNTNILCENKVMKENWNAENWQKMENRGSLWNSLNQTTVNRIGKIAILC
jgi:hypothetical protein